MEHTPWHTVSEAYQAEGDSQWSDITQDLGITVPEEYQEWLYEYDPFQEEAIKGAAYGDIEGQYAGGISEMMKARQPSKAGGSFAGAGSLLDMTTKGAYGDVGRGARGTLMGMMADVVGERKDYRTDTIQSLKDIRALAGKDVFGKSGGPSTGETRINDAGETEYYFNGAWGSGADYNDFLARRYQYESWEQG